MRHLSDRYCVLLFAIAGVAQYFRNQAVICLTPHASGANYSASHWTYIRDRNSMSNKCKEAEKPVVFLKDASARQRWELFHQAIATAKQSNLAALDDSDGVKTDRKNDGPMLSIVR